MSAGDSSDHQTKRMQDARRPNPDPDWLEPLRVRLTEIARRRVREDSVEDLVQDTLRIVLERGLPVAREEGRDRPPLKWCFMTLRNVIGNWYQKQRDQTDVQDLPLAAPGPDPLSALAREERDRRIHEALDELRRQSRDCAGWLWAVAEGTKPAELADRAGVAADAFYRRLYRCRKKLEALLLERELRP